LDLPDKGAVAFNAGLLGAEGLTIAVADATDVALPIALLALLLGKL